MVEESFYSVANHFLNIIAYTSIIDRDAKKVNIASGSKLQN